MDPDFITDPKIRAIMAKLNNQELPPEEEQKPEEIKQEKKIDPKPPKSFEEFLKAECIDEWPQRITSEGLLDLDEEKKLLGTKEDIFNELKNSVPLEMKMFTELEDRLKEFEDRLNHLADKMIIEDEPFAADTHTLPLSVNKAFMTEMGEMDAVKTHPSSRGSRKEDFIDSVLETRKKAIEYCSFPGFRKGEPMDLPLGLEGPQILNRVTKAQDLNPGLRKFWKRIFQSEASVAMLRDSFWWFFLDKFEVDHPKDKSCLFDRIADSFVALFTSVNPEIKDKVFQVYPDCLAQAIYAAYHEAFPESERQFQDDFKQYVVNVCHEWIAGIRPPAGSWMHWDIKRLEPKNMRNTERAEAAKTMLDAAALNKDVNQSLDMDDFHKVLQRLGSPDGQIVPATAPPGATRELTKLTAKTADTNLSAIPVAGAYPPASPSREAQCGSPRKDPKQSTQVGPGPELERVMFNLAGRSPLVAHFMHMRQLKENKNYGKKVRRTQVTKLQAPGPTYKQLINKSMAQSNTLSKEYKKICDITHQEIIRIEKQQLETNRKIEKLQKDLMFCKNSYEVKIMSETILDDKKTDTAPKLAITGSGTGDGLSSDGET